MKLESRSKVNASCSISEGSPPLFGRVTGVPWPPNTAGGEDIELTDEEGCISLTRLSITDSRSRIVKDAISRLDASCLMYSQVIPIFWQAEQVGRKLSLQAQTEYQYSVNDRDDTLPHFGPCYQKRGMCTVSAFSHGMSDTLLRRADEGNQSLVRYASHLCPLERCS